MISIIMISLLFGPQMPSANPLNNGADNFSPEYIFEDDIIVYDVQDSEEDSLPDAVESALRLWDMKDMQVIVPYTTPNDLSDHQKEQINMALQEFNTKTCIVFKERSNETDYLHIDPVNYPLSCRSAVGKKGGKQVVRCGNCKVNDSFNYGVLIHELMHAIGFMHEQNRSDRDAIINIDFDEIENYERDEGWPNGTWAKQFIKCNYTRIGRKYGCKILNSYDKQSITHYPATLGESNPRTIITSKVPCGEEGCNFGQRVGLSNGDIADIEKLYQCSIKYQQHQVLCDAKIERKKNTWSSDYNRLLKKSEDESIENLKTKVDLLSDVTKHQSMMLEHMANQTSHLILLTKKMNKVERALYDSNQTTPVIAKSMSTTSPRSTTFSPIVNRCTIGGEAGDGTSRGSCDEGLLCQSDGSCVDTCKDGGLPGDSTSRGTCNEGYLCTASGDCAQGCRVNGNEIGDGRNQGNCEVDHICLSSGFCKHRIISVTSSCHSTYDTSQKLIYSSNYPSDYSTNENCVWKISGPPGRQLHLTFHSFKTELNADNLTVYDGPTVNSNKHKNFHGTNLPQNIFSASNSLTLQFISDGKNNFPGFELEYALKTYDNYEIIQNKRCKGDYKVFSALYVAMSKCSTYSCKIVDEGCDDLGRYKLYQQCNEEMEENVNDGSCIYRRSLPGKD